MSPDHHQKSHKGKRGKKGDDGPPSSRILLASPFLLIAAATSMAFDPEGLLKLITPLMAQPQLTWGNSTVQFKGKITHIKPLDFWLNTNTVIFTPSLLSWDPLSQLQSRQLSLDLGVIYMILLFEAARSANRSTLAAKGNTIAMASQLATIGVVGPLYFFYHYVYCVPLLKFGDSKKRLIDGRYARAVIPAVALGYFLPFKMMTAWARTPDRQVSWMMIWQFYPLLAAAVQFIVARLFVNRSMQLRPYRDMTTTIGLSIGLAALVSGLSWLSFHSSDFGHHELFIPHAAPSSSLPDWLKRLARSVMTHDDLTAAARVPEWMLAIRKIFQVDLLSPLSSAFIWLALLYYDMLQAGLIRSVLEFLKCTAIAVVTTCSVGPGAAVGLGWWYREKLLARPLSPEVQKTA